MRRTPTPAELAPWFLLRDHRFAAHKFRRQSPTGPYIADFLCYAERLIIEADGGQHADSSPDAARTRWLEAQGYRVLRFWNHEILTDPDSVALQLHHALLAPSPRSPAASRPLPQGERERKQP
jgi:adenine-specific DNA-methyltransferase